MKAELDVAEARMSEAITASALRGLPADPDGLRDYWAAADIELRRAILHATSLRVVVHAPGRGQKVFDPATVEVTRS